MGSLDLICLKAGADSVYRLAKRIAGRMTFDKDPDRIETAANKKEKDKQTKGLIRNLAKVSHSNPVTVAEYLVSYVSLLLSCCMSSLSARLVHQLHLLPVHACGVPAAHIGCLQVRTVSCTAEESLLDSTMHRDTVGLLSTLFRCVICYSVTHTPTCCCHSGSGKQSASTFHGTCLISSRVFMYTAEALQAKGIHKPLL